METKKDLRAAGADSNPINRTPASSRVEPSEIVLVYSNLQLNPKIDPNEFSWEPPKGEGMRIIDETQAITTQLANTLNELAVRKKAEAAKEGSELPQGITIPRPPGDAQPANPPAAEPTIKVPTAK